MSRKLRVGIIFGGRSGEHEISLRSAESVLAAMDRSKYEAVPIGITKEGRWLSSPNALSLLPAEEIAETFKSGTPVVLAAEPTVKRSLDVVFPVLHGPLGEDGTIQGLLELADVPYVGAGVLGSAVAMDKDVMKKLIGAAGLPTPEYWSLLGGEIDHFIDVRASELPYPVFVKPANLGSSVGITKVHSSDALGAALELAGEYDRKIMVEKGIDAREIELSVLGNEEPIASVPGEVRPSREFYDYQAKYVDDDSELVIPAPLRDNQTAEARSLALETYKALECSGLGRVDLLLESDTEKFYVNELNTLPGFTSISMYPRLWEASGIPYPELIDRLINLAIERHEQRSKLRTSYDQLPPGS